MKRFLTLVWLLALIAESQAKILTVSNREGDNAQYSTIAEAMEAADIDDTLYISGSPDSYGNFTVTKKLTFMGPGYNSKKDLSSAAQMGTITLVAASSGSVFIGLKSPGIIVSSTNQTVNNVSIIRCEVTTISYSNSSNAFSKEWVIENNIINSLRGNLTSNSYQNNFVVSNNIFQTEIRNVGFSLISNNIFTGTSNNDSFNTCTDNTLANNIFYNRNPGGLSNSIFNNNISFGGSNPDIPYGDNTGTVNFVGDDPLFEDVTSNVFSLDFNYRLKSSSVGVNAGSDGTDIGVFGGTGFAEGGEPAIPVIRVFNILNPIIPQNGNLRIEIQAESKN